ncbi:MAG: FtsW/RodA/SpoVE family cell cycle protein [Bacillota bacterium]|jgi:rod shape determining protein RodA|uniref:FtsW/RodA/SpoVE family cell cycle protein n=1 Tax=Bacillaceae TaxID=186817 RepID=UPI00064FFBDB|nr:MULTISPECIES: FtsW/RodA/SpoVE family cell cycle protein [Bacillaceae]KML44184.1 cell cycle protein [Cytobacillus firmus]MCC3649656.1 rod shape-determining protein RodA [Cytobacillus oceanisediminis]MCS0656163.1 rod shape-determining protein RodA [Cytobacillus firmus]MCU1808552.1 rod shape-determining protein RodA [Cytobacillus firmus]WHY34446.1 FtsW/RodA/SpoVE family cell cycle protein [Cytobacillus firmus]
MNQNNRFSDRFDWTLCFLLLLFFLISCIAIYSGQSSNQYEGNFVISQIKNYIVGAVIVGIVMYFDSEQIRRLTWLLYGLGILLLVGLFIAPESIAPERKGATLWYIIPGLGSVQPSEFVKVFLIIALSKIIADHHLKYQAKTAGTDFFLLIKLGTATLLPLGLIIIEDLGTALVIIAILAGIILVSGITWKILVPIYGILGALAGTVLYLVIIAPEILEKYLGIDPYQFSRIYSWLDPVNHKQGAGMQLYNSMLAIGSGLISGKGFTDRQVYVPDAHTDFIFSVIGEEYGFFGASVVISLFFLLIYHLTKTGLETTDPFNTYICVGVISMITFHVFQNIGMTIQVLPITGIPLPFISYGGSSLMGNMMAMGLIFSIHYHHKNYMFSTDSNYVAK